jgi:tRNA (guanine-N7-)-methyltransferase
MKKESQNFQNKFSDSRVLRSFGRIKSRKLSDHKNNLLTDFLPRFQAIKPTQNSNKNILEIGFGFGDFLFEKAKNNPEVNFFGFEPHLNGVVNLLAKLEVEELQNIKISTQDVREALTNFSDNFFDEIYILFPDPWPKAKHFKRRLINQYFLDEILAPKIKNNAKLIIATDHDSYKIWILGALLSSKKFSWNAQSKKDWQNFPDDWTITKYQKKAALEGRVSVIFNATKNAI